MKDLKFKIVLGFLIVAIVIIIGLGFNIFKKDKELQEYIIQKNESDNKIEELEKDLNEWKSKKDSYYDIYEVMQKCEKDKHYSIDSMFYCVNEAAAKWEKVLNNNYAKLKKILTPAQYKLLQNSQNKWQMYKNAKLEFLQSTFGSSTGVYYQNQINIQTAIINEERARYLDMIIKAKENNAFVLP